MLHPQPVVLPALAIDPPLKSVLMLRIKKYLITGLLVWLPLAVSLWVVLWLYGLLDDIFIKFISLVIAVFSAPAGHWLQNVRETPGLGVLVVLTVLVLSGVFVSNVFGRWWMGRFDWLMTHTPFLKTIYSSVKKLSDTLFSDNGKAFRKAVLIEYPRAGVRTIGFITGEPAEEVAHHLNGDWVSVYVPTTPNPTSGFFLMLPALDVIELDMSVDEALTYVISMGAVKPDSHELPEANAAQFSQSPT